MKPEDQTGTTPVGTGDKTDTISEANTVSGKADVAIEGAGEGEPEAPPVKKFMGVSVDLLVKCTVWFVFLLINAFNPAVAKFSYSLDDGSSGKKKYATTTVTTISFVISFAIAQILSVVMYGVQSWKDCYNIRGILWIAPVSIGYSISEFLGLFALSMVSPIVYSIIRKARLLFTVIFARVLLGRKRSTVQWLVVIALTIAILGFTLFGFSDPKAAGVQIDLLGVILVICNILLSVLNSLYADWVYKKLKFPMIVQICQGRITSAIASLIVAVTHISVEGWWQYGFFGGPEGGWDWRVGILVMWFVFRDWISTFILKNLDAVWKALASAAAVVIVYILDTTLFSKTKPNATLFCIIAVVAVDVLLFAIDGVNQGKVKKEKESLKKLLAPEVREELEAEERLKAAAIKAKGPTCLGFPLKKLICCKKNKTAEA
eukprot:GHVT01096486.1.p1 GENE.GHVT01096486.1~~GHVT01096486.1.p1  ORF type:complete len:432 (+),score=57.27 GHVT01096486.1:752-2047(+)